MFLYQELESALKYMPNPELPNIVKDNMAEHIELREYQEDAFKYFMTYFENDTIKKNKQVHTLFHMATGSGKTVIMAGLILYLYSKGYSNFLFFVDKTSIIAKTKENFINKTSNKYLFSQDLEHLGERIKINQVDNFQNVSDKDINICFMSIQGLHNTLTFPKENSLSIQDFEDNKVVLISDESHHINAMTKKKKTKSEEEIEDSWEYSVMRAFGSNRDNIMLEFTATCDLEDKNVKAKYIDKIVFNYTLKEFRNSGYTKDFQNFATDSDLWERTLMALVLSEYRKSLFNQNGINVKPVIMLKSKKIKESESFYKEFFEKVPNLRSEDLKLLEKSNIGILKKAINYFEEKDPTLELLEHSIKDGFTEESAIIMNGSSDDNDENQVIVNTLEDVENPVRIVFAVDMLNEGWDVLNLFDIVRLYDKRDGRNGKPGKTTISEAQLIGRGARYCPFVVNEEDNRFKRKFDNDIENPNRILETMFFHSRNDSRYISELKQALIMTGMQDEEPEQRTYELKETFKDTEFYKKGFVFSNRREKTNREEVESLEGKFRYKNYLYEVPSKVGYGTTESLFGESTQKQDESRTRKSLSVSIKDIKYSILLGASERFRELKFNVIKKKYPHIETMKDFLTGNEYLGNATIEFHYYEDEGIEGIDYYNALYKKVFPDIAIHINSIKPSYRGTTEFYPVKVCDVLRDKTIYLSSIKDNGGHGESQNECSNPNYKLDLLKEDWYVFNDNYGTSEEKLFVKYFKNNIAPKLELRGLEYYVIRNERVPEFVIYNFEDGSRFEPDFLLLVRKKKLSNEIDTEQIYIEPKGNQLLETDKWKEEFLLEIEDNHKVESGILAVGEYNIIGMPFFNNDNRMEEFESAVDEWLGVETKYEPSYDNESGLVAERK